MDDDNELLSRYKAWLQATEADSSAALTIETWYAYRPSVTETRRPWGSFPPMDMAEFEAQLAICAAMEALYTRSLEQLGCPAVDADAAFKEPEQPGARFSLKGRAKMESVPPPEERVIGTRRKRKSSHSGERRAVEESIHRETSSQSSSTDAHSAYDPAAPPFACAVETPERHVAAVGVLPPPLPTPPSMTHKDELRHGVGGSRIERRKKVNPSVPITELTKDHSLSSKIEDSRQVFCTPEQDVCASPNEGHSRDKHSSGPPLGNNADVAAPPPNPMAPFASAVTTSGTWPVRMSSLRRISMAKPSASSSRIGLPPPLPQPQVPPSLLPQPHAPQVSLSQQDGAPPAVPAPGLSSPVPPEKSEVLNTHGELAGSCNYDKMSISHATKASGDYLNTPTRNSSVEQHMAESHSLNLGVARLDGSKRLRTLPKPEEGQPAKTRPRRGLKRLQIEPTDEQSATTASTTKMKPKSTNSSVDAQCHYLPVQTQPAGQEQMNGEQEVGVPMDPLAPKRVPSPDEGIDANTDSHRRTGEKKLEQQTTSQEHSISHHLPLTTAIKARLEDSMNTSSTHNTSRTSAKQLLMSLDTPNPNPTKSEKTSRQIDQRRISQPQQEADSGIGDLPPQPPRAKVLVIKSVTQKGHSGRTMPTEDQHSRPQKADPSLRSFSWLSASSTTSQRKSPDSAVPISSLGDASRNVGTTQATLTTKPPLTSIVQPEGTRAPSPTKVHERESYELPITTRMVMNVRPLGLPIIEVESAFPDVEATTLSSLSSELRSMTISAAATTATKMDAVRSFIVNSRPSPQTDAIYREYSNESQPTVNTICSLIQFKRPQTLL